MSDSILEIQGLSKRFGPVLAVSDLTLSVERGTVYGILGPNGSGKTTTLSMLLGVLQPDAGSFKWFGGLRGPAARKRIGALLETPNFYPWMTAAENLRILSHIKGADHRKNGELIEMVGLGQRNTAAFRTYSLGMKQRLALAGALVGDPDVLILDEPANGLDPQGIAEVRSIVREIAGLGKTILMSSHILDEVEKVCSHVAILKNGQLLASGTTGSILDNRMECEAGAAQLDELMQFLEGHPEVAAARICHEGLVRFEMPGDADPAQLNQQAFAKGIILSHLVCRKRSLEAEFLKITNSH